MIFLHNIFSFCYVYHFLYFHLCMFLLKSGNLDTIELNFLLYYYLSFHQYVQLLTVFC